MLEDGESNVLEIEIGKCSVRLSILHVASNNESDMLEDLVSFLDS